MKYQALIDLQLKGGIKGVRQNGHMVGSLPARDPARRLSCPLPPPAFQRFTPIMTSSTHPGSSVQHSGQMERQRRTPSAGECAISSILAFVRLPHHVLVLSTPYKDKAYMGRSTQPDRANSNKSRCRRDPLLQSFPLRPSSLRHISSQCAEKRAHLLQIHSLSPTTYPTGCWGNLTKN